MPELWLFKKSASAAHSEEKALCACNQLSLGVKTYSASAALLSSAPDFRVSSSSFFSPSFLAVKISQFVTCSKLFWRQARDLVSQQPKKGTRHFG